MAEVLLQNALDGMTVSSAGVGALVDFPPDDHAIALMDERGHDIRGHRAQAFTGAMGLKHDLILTMSMDQRTRVEKRWALLHGRVFTLGFFDDVDIDDPFRKGEDAFREALAGIDEGIEQWQRRLRKA
ncbi:MAG: low molecular weight phosphotyrosine protein phosphatase [Pseudomonadota bacterium]